MTLALPSLGGVAALRRADRWTLGAGAAVLVWILGSAWFLVAVVGKAQDLDVRIEVAVRDSIRFADIIERSSALQARRDSIAGRVSIIQEIDGARYLWPHLMDEVARALPQYVWITRFAQIFQEELPIFRIEARAGTYFALTAFMENLEASPFVRGVQLLGSEQAIVPLAGGGDRAVYEFVLEASASEPPPGVLQTVPLFGPSVIPPGEEN